LQKLIQSLALLGAAAVGAGIASAARPTVNVTVTVPRVTKAPVRHVVEAQVRAPRHVRRIIKPKPAPVHHRATRSLYVHTVSQTVMRARGCASGRRGTHGLVILDFGRLSTRHHTLGTILFSERFASLTDMTRALAAYAQGYVRCVSPNSRAQIVLARGTSNYSPGVASTYWAGRHWAAATARFTRYLTRHHLEARVTSAAAVDAEPGWDRSFTRTRGFFAGFRAQRSGSLLYNYGSLDGGAGAIWSVRQALYVAGGNRDVRVVPEIYHHEMARQWARLARLGAHRSHPLRFAGLMTQHSPGCRRCGLTPREARAALSKELGRHPKTRAAIGDLQMITNIS
jgi:hypothetical protein